MLGVVGRSRRRKERKSFLELRQRSDHSQPDEAPCRLISFLSETSEIAKRKSFFSVPLEHCGTARNLRKERQGVFRRMRNKKRLSLLLFPPAGCYEFERSRVVSYFFFLSGSSAAIKREEDKSVQRPNSHQKRRKRDPTQILDLR